MTDPENVITRRSQHPIVRGMVGVAAFVLVAESFIWLTSVSWALVIPVSDRTVIDLGEVPQWIIGVVAALGLLKAWKAEQHAREAAAIGAANATAIDTVKKQTDGVLDKVAALSKQAGKDEEHKEEVVKVAAAKEVARVDAVADAETAAKVQAIEAATSPNETSKA